MARNLFGSRFACGSVLAGVLAGGDVDIVSAVLARGGPPKGSPLSSASHTP